LLAREADYFVNKVFVYGTLKKGHGNHRLLEGSKLLGNVITKPMFTMVSLGGFPGVLLEGSTPIVGEVYEVDEVTMQHLDYLEGYPNFYDRTQIHTEHGSAWMYFLGPTYKDSHDIVEDGDWK
jgi:gamma-glutamylcyclotransferase (GGCT)/AIG2-like uncharacterized protein YtfP